MDVWRIGIARQGVGETIKSGSIRGPVTWVEEAGPLPLPRGSFRARAGRDLHLFAEAYDYRTRKGRIDVLRFDAKLQLLSREPCLREPWHLSYPFPIEWAERLGSFPRRIAPAD